MRSVNDADGRSGARWFGAAVSWVLVACMLAAAGVRADAPPTDPDALRRSLEMLHLEMKVRVLQTYYERAGLYVPSQWTQQIQDEYQKLSAEAGGKAALKNADVDAWLAESTKARQNEVLAMYKLLEGTILPKLIAREKDSNTKKQLELTLNQAKQHSAKTSLEVAQLIEGLVKPVMDANRGKADSTQELLWYRSAREVYRGAIKESDSLLTSIAAYEKQRQEVEARLITLKEYEEYLATAKAVQDPVGTMLDKAKEKAKAKVVEYFKTNYTDFDEKKFDTFLSDRAKDYDTIGKLRDQIKNLDDDVDLKVNPTVQDAAKRYAILGALYKYTLGKVKDSPAMQGMGPLVNFIAIYGEMLNLIPSIAQQTQALVNKADQDFRNVRALDALAATGLPPGDLRELTLFNSLGLQVAMDASIDTVTSPSAHFYLVVDKRNFAKLSSEEFYRMMLAIAHERFINAPQEASRGVSDWVHENMFEWQSTSVISPMTSESYLKDLKSKGKKLPWSEKDLVDLAHNLPVKLAGKQWTPDTLAAEADRKLDARAEQLIVHTALGDYQLGYQNDWITFKAELQKYGVAFSRDQILKLFTFYHQSGANAGHLDRYLVKLGDERSARAHGIARAGVPVVVAANGGQPLTPGEAQTLAASVIVSDLAPGRQVDATAVWTLPAGVAAPAPTAVKLGNGVKEVTCPIMIPKTIKGESIQAKVTIRIPLERGEATLIGSTDVAIVATPATPSDSPPPSTPGTTGPKAVASAPPPRQFNGIEQFDLEVPAPGAVEARVQRLSDFQNAIEITGEVLAKVDAKVPSTFIIYHLYRSDSPTGPFVRSRHQDEVIDWTKAPPNRVISQEGWLAADRFRIVDKEVSNHDDAGRPVRGPSYYRVGILPSDENGSAIGPERLSNVTPLGRAMIRFARDCGCQEGPKDELTALSPTNDRFTLRVALSLEDQCFDGQGAVITATSGSWTGHYYTDRREGDVYYTSVGNDIGRTNSTALLHIPYHAEGGDVTVRAVWGDLSATRTFHYSADPKQVQYEHNFPAARPGADARKPLPTDPNARDNALGDRAEFAYWSGDVGGYRQNRFEQLRLETEMHWSGQSRGGTIVRAADQWAALSGDRAGAANLWLAAQAAYEEGVPADRRNKFSPGDEHRPRPPYWPEDPAYKPETVDYATMAAEKPPAPARAPDVRPDSAPRSVNQHSKIDVTQDDGKVPKAKGPMIDVPLDDGKPPKGNGPVIDVPLDRPDSVRK